MKAKNKGSTSRKGLRTFLKIGGGFVAVVTVAILVAGRTSSEVVVEHTFNAPVDRVWSLWTDPEAMKKWWSPKDFTAPIIQSEFQVNGRFLLSMKAPNGEMSYNTGTYKEIVPKKKIVSTMSFSDDKGKVIPGPEVPVPGVWPDEVTVTVEFQEVEGKTRVRIQEVGIPLIMKLFASMGWEQQFDKFEALL